MKLYFDVTLAAQAFTSTTRPSGSATSSSRSLVALVAAEVHRAFPRLLRVAADAVPIIELDAASVSVPGPGR